MHRLEHQDGTIESQMLNTGNYFFLDRTVSHSFIDPSPGFNVLNLLFLPSLFGNNFSDSDSLAKILSHHIVDFTTETFNIPLENRIYYDSDGTILPLFEKAWRTYRSRGFGCRSLLRCYILEILINTGKKVLEESVLPLENRTVTYICDYLNAHYAEKITLSDICREQYLNTSFVSRKFKEVVGKNFEEYLQQIRVQKACIMLIETNSSIDTIASNVGYSDSGSFRLIFKRFIGISPSEFRKMNT